jgi:hypothetical protein
MAGRGSGVSSWVGGLLKVRLPRRSNGRRGCAATCCNPPQQALGHARFSRSKSKRSVTTTCPAHHGPVDPKLVSDCQQQVILCLAPDDGPRHAAGQALAGVHARAAAAHGAAAGGAAALLVAVGPAQPLLRLLLLALARVLRAAGARPRGERPAGAGAVPPRCLHAHIIVHINVPAGRGKQGREEAGYMMEVNNWVAPTLQCASSLQACKGCH